MIVFQTRHYSDLRLKPEEHIVVFISFNHERITFTSMCIDTEVIQHTANNERWIASKFTQYPGGHGGGCGLAMCSSDGNPLFISHQLTEKIRAFVYRDICMLRCQDLGIVCVDSR